MDTEAVTLFLALLAVLCQIFVVVALGFLVTGRWSTLRDALGSQALVLATLIALVATLGSLYLSEVANFRPCPLCWYQRYAMYPLVPVLGLAAWRPQRRMRRMAVRALRPDRLLRRIAVVLAGAGGVIATYHVLLERYPSLDSDVCDPSNPCTLVWFEHFGYLTIPGMALSGFAAILVLLALSRRSA